MKKHALLILSMIALLVVSGLAQEEPQDEQPQDLTELLLGQDTFREIFEDDSWVLAATGAFPNNPPGVINTATAVYESPARRLSWAILEYEAPELALDFIDASSAGLRSNLTGDAEDVTEFLNVDAEGVERENLADLAVIARFSEGARKRLTLVRGNLAIFFESDLPDETMILLAQRQLDHLAELGR